MDRLSCDRMFATVVETGSFAAAARRLGTSSGQASKLVARLEAELGAQLMQRSTRALSLTEAGRAYHERLRPLLEEFDALDAEMRREGFEPRGLLRLTVPLSFGSAILAPLLGDFAARHPKVALDVAFSDRVANLVEEGFDMALRIGQPRDSALIAKRLCAVRLVTCAAPAYLARRGRPERPADLAAHDCILDGNLAQPGLWPLRGPGGAAQPIQLAGRITFANAEACAMAARAGLGICFGPSFVSGPMIRTGELVPVLEAFEAEPLSLHAIYPPSRHLAAKSRALIDFLAETFRGPPSWDAALPNRKQ